MIIDQGILADLARMDINATPEGSETRIQVPPMLFPQLDVRRPARFQLTTSFLGPVLGTVTSAMVILDAVQAASQGLKLTTLFSWTSGQYELYVSGLLLSDFSQAVTADTFVEVRLESSDTFFGGLLGIPAVAGAVIHPPVFNTKISFPPIIASGPGVPTTYRLNVRVLGTAVGQNARVRILAYLAKLL